MDNETEMKMMPNQDKVSLKSKTKEKFNHLFSTGSKSSSKKLNYETKSGICVEDGNTDETALIPGTEDTEGNNELSVSQEENKIEDESRVVKTDKLKKKKRKKTKHADSQSAISDDGIYREEQFNCDRLVKNDVDSNSQEVVQSKHDHVRQKKTKKLKKQAELELQDKNENELSETGCKSPMKDLKNEEDTPVSSNTSTSKSDILSEQASCIEDDGNVLGIIVHKCDQLRKNYLTTHPVVKVHVVDASSGNYLKKLTKSRCVTSYYESERIDYILPMLTDPFDIRKAKLAAPVWEQTLMFNENYSYIANQCDVIIFFEILDFASANLQTLGMTKKGWYHIAWAFVKLKGTNGVYNTEKTLRLQLYKYQNLRRLCELESLDIFQMWKKYKKLQYQSSLYVTIKPLEVPKNIHPVIRSFYPTQEERGSSDLANVLQRKESLAGKSIKKNPDWMKLPNQAFKIPKEKYLELKPSSKGCFTLKFSNNGRYLACASQKDAYYVIVVYSFPDGEFKAEFPGHMGIIYELDWSKDDKTLLSASADCTVHVWSIKSCSSSSLVILPHPSFVYSSKFHPLVDAIIVTGCYDHIVRIWGIKKMNNQHKARLIQELEGHNNFINTLCFGDQGNKLFVGDSQGKITVWNVYFTEHPSKKGVTRDWTLHKVFSIHEIKGLCINSISLHASEQKLLIHTRDNNLRLFDLRIESATHKYEGIVNYQQQIRSCFTPCGSFIFSGSEDGLVFVWNTETSDVVTRYSSLPFKRTVSCVHFHPHDNYVSFCSNEANTPVLVYKYDFKYNDSLHEMTANFKGKNNQLNASSSMDLNSSKKHVSFDMEIDKSKRIKKALKKMDSVINDSVSFTKTSSLTFGALKALQTCDLDTPDNVSSVRSPSPSAMSPHAFSFPALAAELQKQAITHQKNLNKNSVEVTRSAKVRTPSFKFQVPSIGSSSEDVKTVETLYSYNASRSDELSFKSGEILKVLHEDNTMWWMGEKKSSGEQGFFPSNYVKNVADNN